MSAPMISVRHVSKRYELGALQTRTNSLREAITQSLRRARTKSARVGESFLALDDVSFDVPRGEVLGVVGRNGAGKSTLLKVLSRITEPTTGRIEMRGRAASLLEVGTGFHPELTGRENVYLNGTILGMRKRDIDRKFDEIVEFAEVQRFIDTPVKRYSSGMYVRLAFGVAAHLDPEILIVDEVLAVGDAEFQKKCLGKMSDVAGTGRTVLFVSHNMSAVRSICTSGIVLGRGRVIENGPIADVVSAYARQSGSTAATSLTFPRSHEKPRFTELSLANPLLEFGETLEIRGKLHSPRTLSVAVEIIMNDERGGAAAFAATAPVGRTMFPLREQTEHEFTLHLGPLPLAAGTYSLQFMLTKPWAEAYHTPAEELTFEVTHSDPEGSGLDFRQSWNRGAFYLPLGSEFR